MGTIRKAGQRDSGTECQTDRCPGPALYLAAPVRCGPEAALEFIEVCAQFVTLGIDFVSYLL
jgi:hypothetical protein